MKYEYVYASNALWVAFHAINVTEPFKYVNFTKVLNHGMLFFSSNPLFSAVFVSIDSKDIKSSSIFSQS